MGDSAISWFVVMCAGLYGVYRFFVALIEAYEQYKKETSSDIW